MQVFMVWLLPYMEMFYEFLECLEFLGVSKVMHYVLVDTRRWNIINTRH